MTRDFYEFLYRPGQELQMVGIVIGIWLIVSHLIAVWKFDELKPMLAKLPRNYNFGVVLFTVCMIWTLAVWSEMDLGEFHAAEKKVQVILVVGGALVAYFVRDFLAVRAIGFFLILLASPILISAFLEPPRTRLLLVILAYAMVIKGMFWVGKPYLLRDQIAWATADKKRWQIACGAGAVYGVLILLCAVLFWDKEAAPDPF
ncbi:MAG: hypothetical protein HKN23_08540 [Verrucomicrobiales bacterium]|nr:hypothetical protein [Verrucomicrobiales bacterium]